MERYYSQVVGMEVLTEAGLKVGRVIDVVLDPDTGKLTGFLLAPRGQKVFSPADVIFWSNRIIIHDADDILETSEIIKVQQVLRRNIPIIKNRVITKDGQYLGHIFDYTMDNKLFVLTKILIAKTFLGLFPYDEKIILYKNILEIKKDAVIVKNPLEPLYIKEKKGPSEKRKLKIEPIPTPS